MLNLKLKSCVALTVMLFNLTFCNALNLVIRYDDYSLDTDSVDRALTLMMHQKQLPWCAGVIPCYHSENFQLTDDKAWIEYLQQLDKQDQMEFALHGFHHTKSDAENHPLEGEFYGLSYEENVRRLTLGKQFLDDNLKTKVITFIPPWNSVDRNAMKALETTGFQILSSKLWYKDDCRKNSLSYYPMLVDHPWNLLPALQKHQNRDGVIVLMFHQPDIIGEHSLEELSLILDSVKQMPWVDVCLFRNLPKSSYLRASCNLDSNLITKYFGLSDILLSTPKILLIRLLNVCIYALLILVIGIVVYRLMRIGVIVHQGGVFAMFRITILLIIAVMSIVVWEHWLSPMKALLVSACLPIITGLLFKLIDLLRK